MKKKKEIDSYEGEKQLQDPIISLEIKPNANEVTVEINFLISD